MGNSPQGAFVFPQFPLYNYIALGDPPQQLRIVSPSGLSSGRVGKPIYGLITFSASVTFEAISNMAADFVARLPFALALVQSF